jgi:hypothetical protein
MRAASNSVPYGVGATVPIVADPPRGVKRE